MGLRKYELSFLLLGATTVVVSSFPCPLPDGQPFCCLFEFVQDELGVLTLGEIFALVENEISVLTLGEIFALVEDEISLGWSGDRSSMGRLSFRSGTARPRPEESISAFGNVLFHCLYFFAGNFLCFDVADCMLTILKAVTFHVPTNAHLGFPGRTIPGWF